VGEVSWWTSRLEPLYWYAKEEEGSKPRAVFVVGVYVIEMSAWPWPWVSVGVLEREDVLGVCMVRDVVLGSRW
jgi:hypothetical protein